MKRSVSYPEDRGHKGCQLAFAFGVQRGRMAAYHCQQDRLNRIPFDTPEKMAYFRGYSKGYAQAIKNVRREFRRHRGTLSGT
jgi:hypothetical protein